MLRLFWGAWVAVQLAGCGGREASNLGARGEGGGVPAIDAGEPRKDARAEADAPSACVVGDAGFTVEPDMCAGLSVLAIARPTIVDDSGDGTISPGEGASLLVSVQEIAGKGFAWYPGVTFTADRPDVEVMFDDWRYAILPCTEESFSAVAKFSASIPRGTPVHFVARLASLNRDCPDAPSSTLDVVVQ
jgi:hypothetical protein